MSSALLRTVACVVLIAMTVVLGVAKDGLAHLPTGAPEQSVELQQAAKRLSSGCEHRSGGSCELQAIQSDLSSKPQHGVTALAFDMPPSPWQRGLDPSAEPDPPRTV